MKRKQPKSRRRTSPPPPATPTRRTGRIGPAEGTHVGFIDLGGRSWEVRRAPEPIGDDDGSALSGLVDYFHGVLWLDSHLSVSTARVLIMMAARVTAGPGAGELPEQLDDEHDDLCEPFAAAMRRIMSQKEEQPNE